MYISWIILIILAIGLFNWGYNRGKEDGFNLCQSTHPDNQMDFDDYDEDDY